MNRLLGKGQRDHKRGSSTRTRADGPLFLPARRRLQQFFALAYSLTLWRGGYQPLSSQDDHSLPSVQASSAPGDSDRSQSRPGSRPEVPFPPGASLPGHAHALPRGQESVHKRVRQSLSLLRAPGQLSPDWLYRVLVSPSLPPPACSPPDRTARSAIRHKSALPDTKSSRHTREDERWQKSRSTDRELFYCR